MPIAGGVFGVLLLGLWMYVILDVILTDSSVCRNLPKLGWLAVVIILPAIGSVAWLLLGRPRNVAFGPGGQRLPSIPNSDSSRPAPMGIEDRPDWPAQAKRMVAGESGKPTRDEIRAAADERSRKLREWESSLIKREKELDDERRKKEKEGD